jgi:hypothetical protein
MGGRYSFNPWVFVLAGCVHAQSLHAADVPSAYRHPTPVPCPAIATTEPPPCTHVDRPFPRISCVAPGKYYFKSAAGLGCAGIVSQIKLDMIQAPDKYGNLQNRYVLTYNLYTGNGFQKDGGEFHIDALLQSGGIVRDILTLPSTGGIGLDLSRCWYGAGQQFRVPPPNYFFALTNFDFVANNVFSILVRVDDARYAGWSFHC